MTRTDVRGNLRTSLMRDKARKLGLAERICLGLAGRRDGARGLPSQDTDGSWYSPRLDQERRAYEEFCAESWGKEQLDTQGEYARLSWLIRLAELAVRQLDDSRAELNALEREMETGTGKRQGEEELTEELIRARRKREREKRLEPLKAKVLEAETQLDTKLSEISALRSRLLEDMHARQMICSRVREHTELRAIAYWNAAHRRHPERDKLPLSSTIQYKDQGQAEFCRSHLPLLEQAEALARSAGVKEAA